jgi:anti-sigma-K factor RskA
VSWHREEFLELCAGYVLDCLDPRDRQRLEEHLALGCPECERALAEYSEGAVLLAKSLPEELPNPSLRDRVMIAASAGRREATQAPRLERIEPGVESRPRMPEPRVVKLEPERRGGGSPWTAIGWALAAALAVVAYLGFAQKQGAGRQVADLEAQLRAAQGRLADEQRWAAVLSAPGARVSVLAATPQARHGLAGRATIDPATRRAVLVLENVTAPPGRDYELWAIRGKAPRALGLIAANSAGRAIVHLDDVGDPRTLNAFAVSLEPKGGAPTTDAPTGPVVLVGKVSE